MKMRGALRSTSAVPEMTDEDLVNKFNDLDHELGLMNALKRLNTSDSKVSAKQNFILVFSETSPLEVLSYESANKAVQALFELEKDSPGKDIMLVRANSSDDVRTAFRNYFSDAHEFISLVEIGCGALSEPLVVTA
jgi:putative GTP pyrophosphokinase